MTIAVDTNILLDILIADKKYFTASKKLLDTWLEQGQLIISEVVYAELASQFVSESELKAFLSSTSIKLVHANEKALALSGKRWRRYSKKREKALQCSECGKFVTVHCENCNGLIPSRQRMVSDFIIGAHAFIFAERLLSRDRGFYKTYFKEIDVRAQ